MNPPLALPKRGTDSAWPDAGATPGVGLVADQSTGRLANAQVTMTRILSLMPAAVLAISAWASEDWPQFRGPGGDGRSDSRDLPLSWSESENVKWKTPVHGKAWSSPVILGDQVWLTTATEDGRELFVVCVDRGTGTILRDEKVVEV